MRDTLGDRISAAVIFMIALAVFSINPYSDFYRDEDYEMAYQAASFYWSYKPDFEGIGVANSLIYQISTFGHALVFFRHGAVPAIYVSFLYTLFELLELPFSASLFALPTAILGATSCSLLFLILRHARVTWWISAAAGLGLILSPLFAALSRGIATFIWIGPVLSLLLCILALIRLRDTFPSRAFLAFALANLLLSDALFFLVLLTLVTAYAFKDVDWLGTSGSRRNVWQPIASSLSDLLHPVIIIPLAAVFLMLLSGALFISLFGDALGKEIPLYSLLLATGKHADFSLNGLTLDRHWLDYPAIAFGEFSLVFILGALISTAVIKAPFGNRLLWGIASIGAAGYGLLIYVVAPPSVDVTHGYQIYTLVPVLLLLALSLERCLQANRNARYYLMALAGLYLICAGLSASGYLFKTPTTVSQEFSHENFGVWKPDYGTKSTGYVSREIIEWNLNINPALPVNVTVFHNPDTPFLSGNWGGFRVYSTPYLFNAGVMQKGDYFSQLIGHPVRIRFEVIDSDEVTVRNLPTCNAQLCAILTVGAGVKRAVYEIVDSEGAPLAQLFVSAPSLPGNLNPGKYSSIQLNEKFDEKSYRFTHFFPERPQQRKLQLIAKIKSNL